MATQSDVFLVTGASGQLGRLVVESLLARGVRNNIATTRSPGQLADFSRSGVDVRAADFDEQNGLVDAFRGATHMLLISTQSVGSRLSQHVAALEAAKAAGVRHIFYTSHAFPEESVSAVAPEHAAMEKAIIASGLTYTILRNFLYSENVLLMLAEPTETGVWYGASNGGRNAFISRRDCADAAAGALLQAALHQNAILNVTGPALYSYEDIARIASRVLGREVRYVDMSAEQYLEHLLATGLPQPFAETFVSFERATSLGDGDLVTDIAASLAGHDLELLEQFLERTLPTMDRSQTLAGLVASQRSST